MLCELGTDRGFWVLWFSMTVLGLVSMVVLSSLLFYPYYVNPSFESWQMKNNPKFPSALMIKKEIIHMCKGLFAATLVPAFTLMAAKWGLTQGYCGSDDKGLSLAAQTVIIFLFAEFYEFTYHWMGHKYSFLWSIHRHHHMFYNPSPFAVIADEWADQFVRTLPLIILPALMPINMDLIFVIFATLFYGYGVYLHWGYESTLLSAHNPIFNTAYHHYLHHAVSAKNRPIYTGFFFKFWDYLFDTNYPGKCCCRRCQPRRSLEDWHKTEKPDYSVLLSVKWWRSTRISDLLDGGGMGIADCTQAQ